MLVAKFGFWREKNEQGSLACWQSMGGAISRTRKGHCGVRGVPGSEGKA